MLKKNTAQALERLKYMQLAFVAWWVAGQVWVFQSTTCKDTNPVLFYYAVALVVLYYVIWTLPLLVCVAICVCLPCVLVAMRLLAEPEGTQEDIIASIPKRTFHVDPTPLPEGQERPSCSICMVEYEEGEEIRVLPCTHEFHVECVDRWLTMKRTCPLCRADVMTGVRAAEEEAKEEASRGRSGSAESIESIELDDTHDRQPMLPSAREVPPV